MFPTRKVDPRKGKLDAKQAARHTNLAVLIESIRKYGILQPPGWTADDKVAWGTGRVLAAIEAGLSEITVVSLPKEMTEQEYLLLRGVENLARNDWKPFEQMEYFASLVEAGLAQTDIAGKLGIDPSVVSTQLTIKRKALPCVLEAYQSGALGVSVAGHIARQDEKAQHELLAQALSGAKRDTIRRKPTAGGEKASNITIVTSAGKATIKGADLTLEQAIEQLKEAVKIMEKGLKDGLSAKTISKASKERAGR